MPAHKPVDQHPDGGIAIWLQVLERACIPGLLHNHPTLKHDAQRREITLGERRASREPTDHTHDLIIVSRKTGARVLTRWRGQLRRAETFRQPRIAARLECLVSVESLIGGRDVQERAVLVALLRPSLVHFRTRSAGPDGHRTVRTDPRGPYVLCHPTLPWPVPHDARATWRGSSRPATGQ